MLTIYHDLDTVQRQEFRLGRRSAAQKFREFPVKVLTGTAVNPLEGIDKEVILRLRYTANATGMSKKHYSLQCTRCGTFHGVR